jgi:cell fate (sporulation/competence/biofilm development) regulator YmcA (YheA/YmcA/DUF963 family)
VNNLSKLQKLIDSLQNQEDIKRFKELEKIIDHNEKIKTEYKKLLDLQKDMVGKEYKKHKDLPTAIKNYEMQKQKMMEFYILEEYLDLLDSINEDLNMIKTIIETEINKELTSE